MKEKLEALLEEAINNLNSCQPYDDSEISYCAGVISAYKKVLELLEEVKQ